MALTDLSVTASDVVEKLPLDASQITATTEPVSTTSIDGFIQDATSDLVGVLQRSNLDAESLPDDAKRQMQSAVEAYAVAEALDAMGFLAAEARKYRQKWTDLYDRYSANPSTIAHQKSRFKTNIDKDKDSSPEFIGTDYEW